MTSEGFSRKWTDSKYDVEVRKIWLELLARARSPRSFGGMKRGGVGREGGEEALRFFTEAKNTCIAK